LEHEASGLAGQVDERERQAARVAELEREQAHVSMLYGWLDRLRARARVWLVAPVW
jgi:hypothetical protein